MLYLSLRSNKLMRPSIVKMDQRAISRIMERIKNEEMLNTMHQMWIQEQRQHLRDSVSIFLQHMPIFSNFIPKFPIVEIRGMMTRLTYLREVDCGNNFR